MSLLSEYDIMRDVQTKLNQMLDINKLNVSFSKDGRTQSSIQEDYIIKLLQTMKEYNWYIPNIRWWFDIAIILNENRFIPINIKITNMNTADNIGNYSIIAYSMTNYEMKYNIQYTNTILNLFENKSVVFEETERDYWFLIISKSFKEHKSNKIFVNSFKGISEITPNYINLPFQIKWNNNLEYKPKTTNEMFKLIRESTMAYNQKKSLLQKHIELFNE